MRRVLAVMVALFALVAAACGGGGDGDSASANRTVEIDMVDTAFRPRTLHLETGERVRFLFHNAGKVAHDAFIGDAEAQQDHEREMREAEDGKHGGHGTDEGAALTVDPGGTEELVHTFDRPGTYEIGCHQPGHFAAGMKVTVEVG
jgi:uncharacterized cupredoxin-like copper-binding protein